MADNAEKANPQLGPVVPCSADAKSDGNDHKTVFDSLDATDEESIDQPMPSDAESANARESDQSDQISIEIEQVTPSRDGSEKPPSDSLEDVRPEADSPSPQPAEDHGNAPSSNVDTGDSSQQDLTEPPLEPSKMAKTPEDNARDENSEAPADKRKKPPRRIGGRRKGPTQASSPAKDKSTFTPQPELICRRASGSWQWEVALVADDECDVMEVRHDGEPLNMVNGEYSLASLAGSLSIDYEDRKSEQLPLFDGTPLVFKTPNDWTGDGRKVGGITSGHFIVMAPREWKRTGSVPIESADCTDASFMAHFFYTKKGEQKKNIGGFEGCDRTLTTTGFELSGDRVFDDCADGELFVGAPPRLCPSSGIVWVRIGEERQGGWKGENFKPAEQPLADVLNGRQGRFFVRVYDGKSRLLDSGEFRYLRDLREIRVNDEPYSAKALFVPPSTGYSPTKVQFVCADDTTIQPNLDATGPHATMQSGGVLSVAPHPAGDRISCALLSGEDRIDTVIKLPRIWWRMEQNDGEADRWRDTPLVMTRQQFREHSNADEIIQLRLPLRVSSVKVGFDEERDRMYRPKKNGDDTEAEISLSDFIDYDQIDQRLNRDALLNVQCGTAVMALIRVSADPVPTITTFESDPRKVKIGETATLHWATQDADSGDVSVSISDGIGVVESNGSMEVMPMETTTFRLRLKTTGVDEVKSIVTVVRNDQGGKVLTLKEIKERLTGVGWSLMEEETGFSIRDLQRIGLVNVILVSISHQKK